MSIHELIRVVAPPATPIAPGGEQELQAAISKCGLRLPADLFDIAATYGSGEFYNGAIEVYNPFTDRYKARVEGELDRLREGLQRGAEFPYGVHPVSPGLFPWGADDNDNAMFWLTEGSPEHWPVVVKTAEDQFEKWEMAVTTFLAQALTNRIKSILWQTPFRQDKLTFKSRAR